MKQLICRIIGHKIFMDSDRECCLRCRQDSFYNIHFYTTLPQLLSRLIVFIKSLKINKHKNSGLPF